MAFSFVRCSRSPSTSRIPPLLPLLLLLIGGLVPGTAVAQGLGSAVIFGDITNEAGEPVAAALVELRYVPTGQVVRGISNAEGRYLLANLRPGGPYDLSVQSTGFAPVEQVALRLEAEQRLRLDITLSERAFVLEGIDVLLDRRFEVSRAGPAVNITREEIQVHPTIGRNLLELAALSPVVVQTADEGGLSISGQNERQNAILIDGALNQDVFGSSVSGVPGAAARAKPIPLDAIEEFRVEVAPFDARTSGFTGGVLNAITRSGTNTWQGSAFSQFRNESLFGGLTFDGADVAPESYSKHTWGFNVGGPLRPEVGHLFVAAEFERLREPPPGFTLGVQDALRARVAPDSMARMTSILQNDYGVDPGTGGQVFLQNPLSNVFVRLDWQFGESHSLTLRHNWAAAARDSTPNRSSFGPYELSSAGYRMDVSNHAFSARLVSRFGAGHSNELSVNLQRSRERSSPASLFPQVDVRVASQFDNVGFTRQVRAGSRYFSQDNALDQEVLQLNESVTLARDEIFTTLGVGVDFFRFRRDYNPGSLGYYRFNSLRELQANQPGYYEINLPGADSRVQFPVVQPSFFAQQEHRLPDGLTLRYGVRWDIPLFPTTPEANPAVEEAFGLRTDQFPSVAGFFSPRVGFNWQSEGEYRTQVRGGLGMFTGQLPYVWMANAFQYDGSRARLLSCEGALAPEFNPGGAAPTTCRGGATGRQTSTVVAFDRDFRYPREFKLTTAIDRELPWDVVVSAEALGVLTFARTVVRDLNLAQPGVPEDQGHADAFGERTHYGTPTPYGYIPKRRVEGLGPVLEIGWEDRSAQAYSLTLQAEKRFSTWLNLTGSYTWSGSTDTQSLTQTDMVANLAATPIRRSASEYTPSPANFDRPRKAVLHARFRAPERAGGTEFTLLYVMQSGAPYSYVYAHDINGDGFSGPGVPLDASNDLVYVPQVPSQLQGTLVARSLFAQFVNGVEPCLQEVRGAIATRNACRTPDLHSLDFRIIQPVRVGGARVELTADLLNVLNLLNSEWGRVWEVDPLVPILGITTRAEQGLDGPLPRSAPILGYTGGVTRDAEGQVRPVLPHNLIVPASQWQAQIGLRVSF